MRKDRVAYLLLTISYVISGKLGLMLALPPGYASPVFLPAGIAVAAAFIVGRSSLLWIFLGSLILNIWVGYSSSQDISSTGLIVASLIAIASTLQAGFGGWGLRRAIGYPAPLDHSAQVLRFLLLSPFISLISATLSVTSLWALSIFDSGSFASNWAAWWIGDTLGVVMTFPLVMIVAGEPRALWRERRLTVAVPILLVFTFVVLVFLKTNQWEYSDSLSEFRQLSQQSVNQIQNKLGEQEAVLEETAALFVHDAKNRVTRKEFHRFVEKSLRRFPMIQALEWASPIDTTLRASFEAAQRKEYPGFEIRERNAAGELQRAGKRATYYPVIYIEPLSGNEPAMGFDLASDAERKATLANTIQSESAVITPAVHLVQERKQQVGVLLLLAVEPNNKASGTVLTILRIGEFMDKLLLDTRPMLYTRLVDMESHETVYDNFVPKIQQVMYEHVFKFGTRLYRLETAPTPAYIQQHHGWQSWTVLAAGILGTGLLGALLLLGTGYTYRIEAIIRDRTGQLKKSEKGLKEAQHIGRIGSWDWDSTTDTVTCSEESYHVLGLAPNKPLPSYENHLKLYTAESAARLNEAVKESIQFGKPYELDLELASSAGNRRWVTARSQIKRDTNGQFAGLSGTLTDISERKQIEIALRDSENLFKAISENDLVGIVISKNRLIQWANPAYEKILGYARGELIGAPSRVIFFSEDEYRALGENAYPVINSGGIYRTVIRYRKKDGLPIYVDVSGTNLNIETGETLWSCIDINDRVENEKELQRSNTELEQFSYAISHDMRQPLRMINSYLQLMQMNLAEKLDKTNREYFNFAIDGAKRLDQMLVGLLDYSRVGRIHDPFAGVESRALLEEAILFLSPAIAEAHADIAIEGQWPRVWVSRDEIVRLIQNLVGNALKYRVAEHAPHIRVISCIFENHWRLCVVDDGIGIEPTQVNRLFRVFQRLQSRANYEGSGIGLALCRRIVEHHGGSIWAESAGEDLGSTFCFELILENNA